MEIVKKIEEGKMLLKVSSSIYEKDAVLNASYKFTDRCYMKIDQIENEISIIFQSKENSISLENIAMSFGNELIDQQVRLNTGREYKAIREQLVKKAFSSINK